MVIDCAQCEFRVVACGDCLVTVLVNYDEKKTIQNIIKKGNQGIDVAAGTGRQALGAQELRALGVLAAAGLVSPLRYRPAQVNELAGAIVALWSCAWPVIGETGTSLGEVLETAKCFHYGLILVTSPKFRHGQSLSARSAGEQTRIRVGCPDHRVAPAARVR